MVIGRIFCPICGNRIDAASRRAFRGRWTAPSTDLTKPRSVAPKTSAVRDAFSRHSGPDPESRDLDPGIKSGVTVLFPQIG